MRLLYIIRDGESQTPPVYRRAPPRFPRLLEEKSIVATKEEGTSSFFFFVSSADSAITTLISRSRQVRLGRRTEEETTGIPGHRKPLGVRHSLRDGLRIPRVPLFDSIASYPSALARSLTPRVFTSTDFFPLDLLSGKSVEGVPSTYCNPTFSSSYKTLE